MDITTRLLEVPTLGHDAGCVVEAADEIERLRHTMIVLLDILRRWEPDNSSDADRHEILQAMYQCGILVRPEFDVYIAAPND